MNIDSREFINFMILVLIIIISVCILRLFILRDNKESFESEAPVDDRYPFQKKYTFTEDPRYDPSAKIIPPINKCPVQELDEATELYEDNLLRGNQWNKCTMKPAESTKNFHKDFFHFRDTTYGNSSMHPDTVDKVAMMYLSGDLGQAREYPNVKIQDIFDNATKCGPNLYERKCVRLPFFDNINNDGYNINNGTTGMLLTRNNWNYPDELVNNGGQMVLSQGEHITADDPEYNKFLPVNALNM